MGTPCYSGFMFPTSASLEFLNIVFEDPIEFWDYPDLTAPYWRWYTNTSLGASVVFDGQSFPLLPGQGFLIPPETSFSCHLEPFATLPVGLYRFDLTPHELMLRDNLSRAFRSERDQGILLPKSIETVERAVLVAQASALVWSSLARFAASLPVPRTLDRRVDLLIRYLDEARDEVPDNPELAALVAMHPDAMIRLFRQQTGETPARWSLRRRIDRACVLLAHTDRTIKDIAGACGFPDRNYFTTGKILPFQAKTLTRNWCEVEALDPPTFHVRIH